jgi:steroid delta-isomerase
MAKPEDIRRTVASYAETTTAGDKERWQTLFAPTATIEDPVGSDLREGPEGVSGFWDFTRSLSSSIEITIQGPICVAGDEAAFPIRIVTLVGDERYALDAVDTMAFDDDARIVKMRAYWDMADMRPVEG